MVARPLPYNLLSQALLPIIALNQQLLLNSMDKTPEEIQHERIVNGQLKADIAAWQERADAPILDRQDAILVEEARTLLLRASESL